MTLFMNAQILQQPVIWNTRVICYCNCNRVIHAREKWSSLPRSETKIVQYAFTYNYESQNGNNEGKNNLTLKLSIKIEPTAARAMSRSLKFTALKLLVNVLCCCAILFVDESQRESSWNSGQTCLCKGEKRITLQYHWLQDVYAKLGRN